jgi:GNAT superfamily N-acetyltransferase
MQNYQIKQIFFVSNKLRQDCFNLAKSAAANIAEAEEVKKNIQKDINKEKHWLFVCTASGTLRGFIKGRPGALPEYVDGLPLGKSCELEWLYVDKKYQRCGIGSGLMKAYADYAKSRAAVSMFGYLSSSRPMKRCFKRFGFETVGWNHLVGKSL